MYKGDLLKKYKFKISLILASALASFSSFTLSPHMIRHSVIVSLIDRILSTPDNVTTPQACRTARDDNRDEDRGAMMLRDQPPSRTNQEQGKHKAES